MLEATSNQDLYDMFKDQSRNREELINNMSKTILTEAGIRRAGQRIRVEKGAHAGQDGTIESINWTDAEVLCREWRRWFGLWWDRRLFTVLNPSWVEPPKAARLCLVGEGTEGPEEVLVGGIGPP